MIALNHTLVGAAIGSQVDNIPAVIGLAIVSHFALDLLPHIDQGSEIKKGGLKPLIKFYLAGVDIFASIFIIVLILMAKPDLNRVAVSLGAFFALIIDLVFNFPFWESWISKTKPFSIVYNFHQKIHQPFMKYEYSVGIPAQLIIIALSIWILLK